jgi:transcription elongation GreA/GreB family factor
LQVNTGFSSLIPVQKHRTARLPVNKQAVLDQLLAVLHAELAALTRAAQGAFAAATDPDSKAENKYDTRTLEASYVARGQAQRVAELQEAVRAFGALSGKSLDSGATITLGSLVSLETPGEVAHYFLGPFAGGTEVVNAGCEIVVITPASALGQKLIGRREGETVALRPGAMAKVVAVL